LKQKAVVLHSRDNVATALDNLKSGHTVKLSVRTEDRSVKLSTDIPFGHKLCIAKIEANSPVIKYGEIIGTATKTIYPGEHVHVHNLVSARARGDLAKGTK